MKCIICEKEFISKRKDAKCCSSTCRSKSKRATDNPIPATDNTLSVASVTDNVTDNKLSVTSHEQHMKIQTDYENNKIKELSDKLGLKPASEIFNIKTEDTHKHDLDYLPKCKEDGCNLRSPQGHNGLCIYHWRGTQEDFGRMSEVSYQELNANQAH